MAYALLAVAHTPLVAAQIDEELFRQLGSDDYRVREAATEALLRDHTIDEQDVKKAIDRSTSFEQKQRLLNIAQHHMIRRFRERLDAVRAPNDQGVIGFRYFDQVVDTPVADEVGIAVLTTYPGFPGHAHLRTGDIITRLDGRKLHRFGQSPLEVTRDFAERIRAVKPGSNIALTVYRDGELRELTVDVASRVEYQQIYPALGEPQLKPPYSDRWSEWYQRLTSLGPVADQSVVGSARTSGRDAEGKAAPI